MEGHQFCGSVAPKRTVLAEPRGFCAGVVRAIAMVERALEIHGPPVYVRKELGYGEIMTDVTSVEDVNFAMPSSLTGVEPVRRHHDN